MSDKFQNKYRIESHRLKNWDYGSNGYYFITMLTQNRECILGKIENDEMILSDFGKIVETEWNKSFEIRNELFLDKFIIMPNHIHAIVILENHNPIVETHGRASLQDNGRASLQNNGRASLQNNGDNKPPIPQRKPKSISSFVAGFKSAVNTKINDYIDNNNLGRPKYNRNNRFWQSNYHDHIIRNDHSYERIKKYITKNPINWVQDKFHKQ